MKPGPKALPVKQRISRSVKIDANGCWIWQLHTQSNGYGVIGLPGPRRMYVHRAAYIEWTGPIPAGIEIDHTCKVRACCNPAHLEAVTKSENVRRRDDRG